MIIARTLGEKETGAKAALPMWMDFMKVAVAGKPDESFSKPNAPKKQLDVPAAAEVSKIVKDDEVPEEPVKDAAPDGAPVVPAKPVGSAPVGGCAWCAVAVGPRA